MTQRQIPIAQRIQSIFHPSDFSDASEVAFAHALKLAVAAQGSLDIMHVAHGKNVEWEDFPSVRQMLERWKLIPAGSDRGAISPLGIQIHKALVEGHDPVKATLGYLEMHPTDLIVLAVRSHEGRMRWFGKAVGESMAKGSGQMSLFIPHGVTGFVSREDGSVSLKEILIPVTSKPRPQPSIEAAERLIRSLDLPDGQVTLLHVGDEAEMPACRLPTHTGWRWNRVAEAGNPVDVILKKAESLEAGLIIMTTDGPDGFLDGLRGTTSERVLHQARCPVAVLPVGSFLG
jgi:nucleotide-binding universal stress UspA family protein